MSDLREDLQTTLATATSSRPDWMLNHAVALERLGENDEAITRFEELLRMQASAVSRNLLRLHPEFAELRKDSRFQKLIQGS